MLQKLHTALLITCITIALPQRSALRSCSDPVNETANPGPVETATTVRTGAENIEKYLPLLKGKSVAVFANQTSIVGRSHLVDTLKKLGVNIKVIFGPEHGFRGNADAGEKVESVTDAATGVPVV